MLQSFIIYFLGESFNLTSIEKVLLLTRVNIFLGPESMTGAECNIECGDDSASEDEEAREPLNQVNIYH